VAREDGLYDVEPSEFVAARNALVKALKAEGEKAEAARIAALRRPSPGAWALNTVARRDGPLVKVALEAVRSLRDASGGTDGAAVRWAVGAEGEATRAVVRAAADVLREKAAAHELDLMATVRASADDDGLAAAIQAGTLTELRSSSGFGFDPEAAPADRPAKRHAAPDDTAERERAAAEEEARRHRAELADRLGRLESKAHRLTERAEAAEQAALEARREADEAEAAVREAKDALDAHDAAD
jgi:hypothetical protein